MHWGYSLPSYNISFWRTLYYEDRTEGKLGKWKEYKSWNQDCKDEQNSKKGFFDAVQLRVGDWGEGAVNIRMRCAFPLSNESTELKPRLVYILFKIRKEILYDKSNTNIKNDSKIVSSRKTLVIG